MCYVLCGGCHSNSGSSSSSSSSSYVVFENMMTCASVFVCVFVLAASTWLPVKNKLLCFAGCCVAVWLSIPRLLLRSLACD